MRRRDDGLLLRYAALSNHYGRTLRRVSRDHFVVTRRLDVRKVHIAVIVRDHLGVHDFKPQRRQVGEQDHRRVTGRQLRRLAEMTQRLVRARRVGVMIGMPLQVVRSEEHTSELQSLMRSSYAVFCLKKKKNKSKREKDKR